MNAITPEQDWDSYQEEPIALPGRPRRQFFTRASALLLALILGAVGFYAGVRVEKGQLSSTASTAGTARLGGAAATGSGATGAGAGSARAALAGAGGGGLAARFGGGAGGFGAAAGNSSFGTVSSVSGNTLYVTDTSGNTIKVTLTPATKITKSLGVSAKSVHPGDGVVVSGIKGSSGTMQAATVSDTGARASGAGGSGSSGSGSGSGGAGSAVSSLFGGG